MSDALSEKISAGDPAPLGLAGFAFTTFVLSFANSGLFHDNTSVSLAMVVIPLALFWGGLAQFVAGLFEMRKGNTFGFTAFCSYGAFWLFFGVLNVLGNMSGSTGSVIDLTSTSGDLTGALGLTLILWGVFTLYMWIPAMHINLTLNLTFLLLWITFFLLGAGDYLNQTGLVALGGFVGIATAVVAAYGSFAIVTNSVLGVKRFPLGFAINILGKQN